MNKKALAAVITGGVFAWSGLMNKKITQTLQDILTGTKPVPGPGSADFAGVDNTGAGTVSTGGSASGDAIASDALRYQGHCYQFGGAPGTDGSGCWDCSSFCNWVIGHDFGLAIPGFPAGKYTGTSHGPPTIAWLASIGTLTTHISRNQVRPGDLFVWQTHMGIALGQNSMISAENPLSGTAVATGNVDQFMPGEVLVCLRLKASVSTPAPGLGRKK